MLLENQGHTNKVYKDEENNLFIKQKSYDGFNHTIDYFLLNNLSFTPKVIKDNKEELVTEWIDAENLEDSFFTDAMLQEFAKDLITLHNSKLKFPKNNIAKRFRTYFKMTQENNVQIEVINKWYRKLSLFIKNIDTSAPTHNDLWPFNLLRTKEKIYFIDWEYSTMGDVHWDLAYFIESANLTKHQEEVFLKAYGDDFEEKYLLVHKILVNALIVLWNRKEKQIVFEDEIYQKRIDKYMNIYLEKYGN
ncbi:phosphotransferase [Metamycoplasma subdolum]|nr:phosphotransferase [Metamycoplasma subdolum]WPB50791.1 phosphotransferase [Metamycoplasma subdolum]